MSRTLPLPGRTLPGKLNGDQYCGQCAACGASSRANSGGRRFDGLTSKSWAGLCGSSPSWHSRSAFLHIAEGRRCNCLAICEAEFVGHKVTSSRSSSSVQRDMAGLGHGGPSTRCHDRRFVRRHFGGCIFFTAARLQSDRHQPLTPSRIISLDDVV